MNILLQQHGTNCWNNRLKELKYLEHIIATTPNKMLQQIGWRSWNICNILLQHWCEAYETTLEIKILATTWNNYCNMRLKQLKHFKNIIATFVPSIWNIQIRTIATSSRNKWNILKQCLQQNLWNKMQHGQNIPQFYLCNILTIQLQHTSEASETTERYNCNI